MKELNWNLFMDQGRQSGSLIRGPRTKRYNLNQKIQFDSFSYLPIHLRRTLNLSQEKVREFVTENLPGYAVKRVIGDGFCMLKSFNEGLSSMEKVVSFDEIIDQLRSELLNRPDFYKVLYKRHKHLGRVEQTPKGTVAVL